MVVKEPVYIDVWGCCTSRDIFAISGNDNVKVGKYYHLPLFTQFDRSGDMVEDRISIEEVDAHKSGYANRMAKAELNREVLEGLQESDSEFIVVDVRFYTYVYYEATFNGSAHHYPRVIVNVDEVNRSVAKKGATIDSFGWRLIDEDDVDFRLDEICDFLKKMYGRNVILLQLKEADRIVDENGNVVPLEQTNRERSLTMEDDLFNRMLDKLNCYYIKCPDNVVAEYYHKWGPVGHGMPVHYTYEFYEYASRCVDIIVSKDKLWLKKCDRLYTELSAFYNKLIHGETASIQNAIGRINARLSAAKTPEKVQETIDFAESLAFDPGNSKIKGRVCEVIADIYLDKKQLGVLSMSEKVLEYLRISADSGESKNRYRLFDALWDIGTPESYEEAVKLVRRSAKKGDPEAMFRFGQALRYGRGAPRNKTAACRYLGEASVECKDARDDYYTMVWNLNRPELDEKLYSFLIGLEKREPLDCYFLGEMLRTGRGCEKDLDEALSYLSEATDLPRARKALFETLCAYGDEERDADAFEIAKAFSMDGDANSMK